MYDYQMIKLGSFIKGQIIEKIATGLTDKSQDINNLYFQLIGLHTVQYIQKTNQKVDIEPLFDLCTQELNRKSAALDYRQDVSVLFDSRLYKSPKLPMLKNVAAINVARHADSLGNDRQTLYISIVSLQSSAIEYAKRAVRDELQQALIRDFKMGYADSFRLVCSHFANLHTPYRLEMELIKKGSEFYWGESRLFADILKK